MLDLIDKYSITTFCGTPTLLSIMARFNSGDSAKTLKNICITGEYMSAETGMKIRWAFPSCEIYHIYGLTEACPRVSYLPPKMFSAYPDCVGIPLKSVSIKVLDSNGKPCSADEEGILYIKGDNVMIGYYRELEKTRAVIKDGWFCTGDVALINEIGLLKIKGRNDDLIIKSGMNIYPAEIGAILKNDARVKEVLVYGYNSPMGTQIGRKIAGDFRSGDEVKRFCAKLLSAFQVPSKIELLDELLKNGSGKVIMGCVV